MVCDYVLVILCRLFIIYLMFMFTVLSGLGRCVPMDIYCSMAQRLANLSSSNICFTTVHTIIKLITIITNIVVHFRWRNQLVTSLPWRRLSPHSQLTVSDFYYLKLDEYEYFCWKSQKNKAILYGSAKSAQIISKSTNLIFLTRLQ